MFGEILRRPLLLPDEELELLQRAQQGDEDAQNRLIESNLRLVIASRVGMCVLACPLKTSCRRARLGLSRRYATSM
jgi:RNA polymerase primary sigma factor